MTHSLPVRTRIYQNHVFDSTYWDQYTPRRGDVVVSTSYKSGTTWTQNIVLQLIFCGQPVPALSDVSPFLEHRTSGIVPKIEMLNAQKHRRLIKSHIPLDAILSTGAIHCGRA